MYRYLIGRLKQLGIDRERLADYLGIQKPAISKRFCGHIPWRIDEMYKIMSLVQAPPEELYIFFPPNGGAGIQNQSSKREGASAQ
ncbi:MAG: helix-turn-helix transcriptional regulator [Oscillibacter ruminantium]|uniref:helix-turn-helix domain-containing protein n=1 Tax=Oscillibacter ruminantium TaxID=1263547 RepID=UPI002B1F33F4|nr:helix-turn-helix transcriptional regulator [Oscillibacter ruminantium]MEA5041585.1 helix-turn-helix transcriptional regulator [Oscillibacter ruminantium]